jgi:hypothetical protein
MCLVIDTNCLAAVFEEKAKNHRGFVPVFDWIRTGRGRMIYGGTKYNIELGRITKILGIVGELSRQRRTIKLPNTTVDPIAVGLKEQFPDPNFNDEHIAALVIASRCCVVCTNDNAAISYLKRTDLFPAGINRPKIYRGHKNHKDLCCDKHIVAICREET